MLDGADLNARPSSGPEGMDRWAPWGFSALVLLLGLFIWEAFPPGIWHDDGVYVLLGRSLAEGEGLRYLGVPGAPLAPKFPPLFPLLLAPVWLLFPSFPGNAGVLGGVNLLILSVAGGLFLAYLRRGLGLSLPLALSAAALAWISTVLWRVGMVPLSEPLFILTLVLALWAGVRMEGEGGGSGILLFLVAGGLAFYARTLGIAVLVGGIGALLLKKRTRAGVGSAVGALLVLLPWALWSRWAARSLPESLGDILGPYGGWLIGEMVRDPVAYSLFLLENGRHLLARILSLLLPGVTGPSLWIGLILVPVSVVGLKALGSRSLVLLLTFLLALMVLLAWPFQEIRLLLPLQPLLILSLVMGFQVLLRSEVLSRRWKAPVMLVAASWILLFVSVSVIRLAGGWPGDPYRVRSEALVKAVQAVEANTTAQAVVGAPEFWAGLHLFTGRTVSPSARFLPLAGDGPPWGSPEAQYALWMEVGVTHLLVEHGGRVHGEALDRVDARCPPGTVQLLDLQPGQFLVALDWDESCRTLLMAR